MIPFPQLALEFILGIGAALFGANAWVLIQSRRSQPGAKGKSAKSTRPRPPSMARVRVSVAIGALLAVWAGLTLVAHR